MQKIYYVGNYSGKECKYRKPTNENYAGTMKMKFIIEELKKLGYFVEVVSLAVDRSIVKAREERIRIDDKEEHYFVPYHGINILGHVRATGANAVKSLYSYLYNTVQEGDVVIVYHAYAYSKEMDKLKQKKSIRLIKQIEEVYCLSHYDVLDKSKLATEEQMFVNSDAYLMINEGLARKYANGKPYAVSYGNYLVYNERDINMTGDIGIVYTGLISRDRGAFSSIESMKYLPDNYSLHILGFGNDEDMVKMRELMSEINDKSERVFFYGTKTGDEYTEFLSHHQLGLCIMDTKDEIAENAFPSKILAYLGNSLLVVASKSKCIVKSKVSEHMIYCDDNEPEKIAQAILSIPKKIYHNPSKLLKELEEDFRKELQNVIMEVQRK